MIVSCHGSEPELSSVYVFCARILHALLTFHHGLPQRQFHDRRDDVIPSAVRATHAFEKEPAGCELPPGGGTVSMQAINLTAVDRGWTGASDVRQWLAIVI